MTRRAATVIAIAASACIGFVAGIAYQRTPAPSAAQQEAVAHFRIRSTGIMKADDAGYRDAQAVAIKSPAVLRAALGRPGMDGLKCLTAHKDPVAWLSGQLRVTTAPDSELMTVRLSGVDPGEGCTIVRAVARAYLDDVVDKEHTERLAHRDKLERKYKENMADVRQRLETFNTLARSLDEKNSADLAAANADLEARRNEIAQIQAVTNQMGILLAASEVDLAMPPRVELIQVAHITGESP